MLNHQTSEQLRRLKLTGMALGFEEQLKQPQTQTLSFEERFGLIVDREWTFRENRRLKRLLKSARLREAACLEDIDYRQRRGLQPSIVRSLASGQWITLHQNVIIIGPTGSGKTYLACALAHQACRQGFTARYLRIPKLLHDLQLAKADGSYAKLLAKLAKLNLLLLDDWGLTPLNPPERRDLLEILDDRYNRTSTLMTSQFPIASWHEAIGDPTIADAILDRLIHQAHKITLEGESMRKIHSSLTLTDSPGV
jgi:DNA replication protein DnaC